MAKTINEYFGFTDSQNVKKGYLYQMCVLSGMHVEVKEGFGGKYIFASNGKEVVALPGGSLTEEAYLINLKNICKANDIDFSNYYEQQQKVKETSSANVYSTYLDSLTEEIIERQSNLTNKNQIENVEDLFKRDYEISQKSDEAVKGPINSREDWERYVKYFYKHGVKNIKEISGIVGMDQEQLLTFINKYTTQIEEAQEEKAVRDLKKVNLEDLNGREL